MKKKVKKLVFCGVIAICGAFMASCKDGNVELPNSDNAKTAALFYSSLGENIKSCMEVPVVVNPTTRATTLKPTFELTDVQRVYIEMPLGEQPVFLNKIETPEQIFNLVRETGAELTLIDNGNNAPSLDMSEAACKDALTPLIRDSKKYLYGKGFTEAEIQEMLKENDADESELVPFVLALAEEEGSQNLGNMTRCADIDWAKVGSCAIQALGFDICFCLNPSKGNTWTRTLIKKAFKTVATKVCGPVGVTVMLIQFSICNWG